MSYGQKDLSPDCQSLTFSLVSGRRGASSVHHVAGLVTSWQGSSECMDLIFCFLASALTLAYSHDQPNQLRVLLVISGGDICVGSSLTGLVIAQHYCGSRRRSSTSQMRRFERYRQEKGFSHFSRLYTYSM